MTWNTVVGRRVFSAPEAKLFCTGICVMIERSDEWGHGLNYGSPLIEGPFERLTDEQKYTGECTLLVSACLLTAIEPAAKTSRVCFRMQAPPRGHAPCWRYCPSAPPDGTSNITVPCPTSLLQCSMMSPPRS
jgi:hypothetical protein